MKNKSTKIALLFSFIFLFVSCKKESTLKTEEKQSSAVLDSLAEKYYDQYLQFYPDRKSVG